MKVIIIEDVEGEIDDLCDAVTKIGNMLMDEGKVKFKQITLTGKLEKWNVETKARQTNYFNWKKRG